MHEQLGETSCHSGPNMKWYTINWLLPSNRSDRVLLSAGAPEVYSFSTRTHGSSRRSALSASFWRVNSFSFFKSSLRAVSHSACDTTLGCSICLLLMIRSPFLCVLSTRSRDMLHAKLVDDDHCQSAGRGCAADHECCAC